MHPQAQEEPVLEVVGAKGLHTLVRERSASALQRSLMSMQCDVGSGRRCDMTSSVNAVPLWSRPEVVTAHHCCRIPHRLLATLMRPVRMPRSSGNFCIGNFFGKNSITYYWWCLRQCAVVPAAISHLHSEIAILKCRLVVNIPDGDVSKGKVGYLLSTKHST